AQIGEERPELLALLEGHVAVFEFLADEPGVGGSIARIGVFAHLDGLDTLYASILGREPAHG
ncbi:MAG: hypothetical protein ACK4QW_17675, partial [Alphaproteobacteria bacterium]